MPNGLLVRRGDAKPFTIPGGTEGMLYPSSPHGDQTIADVSLNGVYPKKGCSLNDVATETLYLLEGRYTVETDGVSHELAPGDLLMVFPGTKYRITGKGRALVFISPAWERNRNQIVPE